MSKNSRIQDEYQIIMNDCKRNHKNFSFISNNSFLHKSFFLWLFKLNLSQGKQDSMNHIWCNVGHDWRSLITFLSWCFKYIYIYIYMFHEWFALAQIHIPQMSFCNEEFLENDALMIKLNIQNIPFESLTAIN